jgi:hypothetical protein
MFTDGLVERPGYDIGQALRTVADAASAHARGPLERMCAAMVAAGPGDGRDDLAVLALRAPGAP